jgi:hypothetical protein
MDIPANGKSRRQKWTDIGTGMMIMLSVFMLTDGIRKIIHHLVSRTSVGFYIVYLSLSFIEALS